MLRISKVTHHAGCFVFAFLLLLSLPALGRSQGTARDSAEAAVWRFIVSQFPDSRPIVLRQPDRPRLRCGYFPNPQCVADALPAEFRPALHDLEEQTRDSSAVPTIVFQLAGFASQDTVQIGDRCRGRPLISITRVGLDPSLTYAIVAFSIAIGAGPYPGCGGASGSTYLLQRGPGREWRIVQTLSRWMT
jgi:hypothetical protein